MTKGGGRRGLIGGETAPSPASTPIQQMTMTSPGQLSPVLLPLPLRPPCLHKTLLPLHLSRHSCHLSCRHGRLLLGENGQSLILKQHAPAVVLRCRPKKGKFRKSTAAVPRLHRHRRRASLLVNPPLNHPSSRYRHQYSWHCRHPHHRRLYRSGERRRCQHNRHQRLLQTYVRLLLQPPRPQRPPRPLNHPCSQCHHQYSWRCRHPCRRRLYRRGERRCRQRHRH